MKVSSTEKLPDYQTIGPKLRIHWDHQEVEREDESGETVTIWECEEAVVPVTASRSQIIEAVMATAYPTPGAEFAALQDNAGEHAEIRRLAFEVASGWEESDEAMWKDQIDSNKAFRLAQSLIIKEQVESKLDTLSDEDYDTLSLVFDRWEPDTAYAIDEKVRWKSVLYKVVQAHTSQADWTPDATPSLFTPYRDPAAGPQPWVQPTGAQDAYLIGERVTHDNPNDGGNIWVYESAIDANTVEPGRDGEFDRYWTPIGLPASPA